MIHTESTGLSGARAPSAAAQRALARGSSVRGSSWSVAAKSAGANAPMTPASGAFVFSPGRNTGGALSMMTAQHPSQHGLDRSRFPGSSSGGVAGADSSMHTASEQHAGSAPNPHPPDDGSPPAIAVHGPTPANPAAKHIPHHTAGAVCSTRAADNASRSSVEDGRVPRVNRSLRHHRTTCNRPQLRAENPSRRNLSPAAQFAQSPRIPRRISSRFPESASAYSPRLSHSRVAIA